MGFDKLKLWYIHGRAYDLEPFLENHPGGVPILKMVQGLNCTELFETYHFQNKPTEQLMEKYRVKIDPSLYTVEEKTKLLDERFLFEQDGFYNDVKRRVQKYFNEKGISHRGTSWWKWLLAVQMSAILIGMYYSFVVGSLFAAAVYGIIRGVTAVTSGHTLSHFSLFRGSANYWLFRFAAPLVLSNVEIWSTSHVISHHVYTLTTDDLQDNYPLKRIQPAMPWKPWHTLQHYYIWIVYAIGLPIWTLVDFFGTIPTFFTGKHEMRRFTMAQRIENFLVFGCNLTLTVFLPFFYHEFYTALLLSFVANAFASSVVVVQIAVNHEVPDTMAKVPLDCKIDWGVHQVLTSHNYGIDSKFFLHLSGGLNLQVEHHLFPGLHYSHYFEIAPIVRQTCKEYGLPYNTSAHLWEAIQKHYDILKFNSTK